MTQFQTVPPPPLSKKLELPKQPAITALTSIPLHIGSEITLELAGAGAKDLKIVPLQGKVNPPLEVVVTSVTPTKQTFTVKALRGGKVAINAEDSTGKRVAGLVVNAGTVQKHSIGTDEMDVDLLADVSRGSDGHVINEIRKLLNNDPHNLFDQRAPHNYHPEKHDMTCGMVCKERSTQLFGKINVLKYDQPYHEPLTKVTKRSDVKYKPETIDQAKIKIIDILKSGSPVRVGVLDAPIGMHPQRGKLIAWHAGGHTVVIVGWSAATDSFMYVDTWPGGSRMIYNGGIAGEQNKNPCEYLGLLTSAFDPDRALKPHDKRLNIIRSVQATEGTFKTASDTFLEVVAGP